MAYVMIRDDVVIAVSDTPQPGIPEFTVVADDDSRLAAFWSPPMTPVEQASFELNLKLTSGLALTSSGAPTLNATYSLDSVSTDQIFQMGLYADRFGKFPSGETTQAYPDISGTPHTFNVTQFVAFLQVVAAMVSTLTTQAGVMAHGGSPSWPQQSASIA